MKTYEALIITGKLEVRFQNNENWFSELANLQEAIMTNNLEQIALCIGRLTELTKNCDSDSREDISSLEHLILENIKAEKETSSFKKEKTDISKEIKEEEDVSWLFEVIEEDEKEEDVSWLFEVVEEEEEEEDEEDDYGDMSWLDKAFEVDE